MSLNSKASRHPKQTINRLKRQCTEWEKIFSKYTSDKGLIFKMHRELEQHNSKKKYSIKMGKRTE
jgi:hypothetical protein